MLKQWLIQADVSKSSDSLGHNRSLNCLIAQAQKISALPSRWQTMSRCTSDTFHLITKVRSKVRRTYHKLKASMASLLISSKCWTTSRRKRRRILSTQHRTNNRGFRCKRLAHSMILKFRASRLSFHFRVRQWQPRCYRNSVSLNTGLNTQKIHLNYKMICSGWKERKIWSARK